MNEVHERLEASVDALSDPWGSGQCQLKLLSEWSVAVAKVATVQGTKLLDGIEALDQGTMATTEGVVAVACFNEVPDGSTSKLGGH